MSSPSFRIFLHPRNWYALAILCLVYIVSWLPWPLIRLIGNALGSFFLFFPSPACATASRNIDLCFPDLKPDERKKLVQRHFRACAITTIALGIGWFAPSWRLKRIAKLKDRHYLDDLLAQNKNVILLSPHFIGLDVGGVRISMEVKLVTMYRVSRSPLIEYLFRKRGRFGALMISHRANFRSLLKSIKSGMPFYYLPDQDLGEQASVFVPFFGIPAATVTALSRIAKSTNATVIPCTTLMNSSGGFEIRFHPPLENFPTDDPLEDARRMNLEVEKFVRRAPEQYMWSYRRFKTRPNNEPSFYIKKN